MEKNTRFELNAFLNHENEAFHIAQTTISSKDNLQLHCHNYAEILWIKSGNGIHIINEEEVPLKQGTLCMIRPDDKHTFRAGKYHDKLLVTNIAFDKKSLELFKQRYFPCSASYFWTKDKLPFCTQLNAGHLNELSSITDSLIIQPRNYIYLDHFMIHIFRMVNSIETKQSDIPDWLAFAIENYKTPEHFKNGIQGFVTLTSRSVDHVNRILQKHTQQTLTDTVLKARLKYASQQLTMTNDPVKSICFDCGFDSISYFYRMFKKHTGLTPVDFRKKNHQIL